jgi:hypothetical protein
MRKISEKIPLFFPYSKQNFTMGFFEWKKFQKKSHCFFPIVNKTLLWDFLNEKNFGKNPIVFSL